MDDLNLPDRHMSQTNGADIVFEGPTAIRASSIL